MGNPFKVGDLVIRKSATLAIAQEVAEVDGNFVRTKANPKFDHHSEFLAYKRPEEVIAIVTDGNTSKAYLKRDGKKVNEVVLKRNKVDRHDLKVLTAYAVQKLLPVDGRELVARPAGYCGAVAVTGPYDDRTRYLSSAYPPGLIMEFFGGKWKDVRISSKMYGAMFHSFEELQKYCHNLGFDIVELRR